MSVRMPQAVAKTGSKKKLPQPVAKIASTELLERIRAETLLRSQRPQETSGSDSIYLRPQGQTRFILVGDLRTSGSDSIYFGRMG
jgi:hypothetical protein